MRARVIPAVTMAVAFSFLAALYAPLELFFTNQKEFLFTFGMLLPPLLLFAALLAALLLGFAVSYVLYVRFFDAVLVFSAVAYICTYIQGMFLCGNLPSLDGSPIDWSAYRAEGLVSVLLWAVVLMIFVLLVRFLHMARVRKLITGLGIFFTAVLLVTVTAVGIQTRHAVPKIDHVVTRDHALTMSTDQNLVVFVVDAADSRAFYDLMTGDDPEFADMLQDFTYYPNTVCAYPYTVHAVPQILEGQWYENQGDYRQFVTAAMDASPLLNTLKNRGYRMGIYEEELFYDGPGALAFENVEQASYRVEQTKALLWNQLKLVWFKYAPFPLKRLCRVHIPDFNRTLRLTNNAAVYTANNADFYADLNTGAIETTDVPCFRFLHIEGAHAPFRYDRDVHVIDSELGSYPQNLEASMTIFAAYLQKLRDAGVYDNTAIVLMADHGYGYDREVLFLGRTNPLLAVKGVGEHHEMQLSQAPISYEDLQTAFQRLLDGAAGDQVFDAREGDARVRRVLIYAYRHEDHMEEYQQTGHAFDLTTLTPTGKVYDYIPPAS